MSRLVLDIFTDGSCNTKCNSGGWAAILLFDSEKILLSGIEENTTHNRMELLAVIRAIEYIDKKFDETLLNVYTDSQYVFRIRERKEKLKKNQFCTKKGTPIQNIDLVKKIIHKIETHEIDFKKVKAHQKPEIIGLNIQSGNSVNINIEVDRLARKMMRDGIKRSKNKVPYKIFS